MAVESSEVKLYRAAVNSDAGTNGGAISATEIVTNVLNNLFPNVSEAERTAGLTRYRKAFVRVEDPDDSDFDSVLLWIDEASAADDYFFLRPGTDTDTQADISSETDWVGTGEIDTFTSSTEIAVEFPSAAGVHDGDTIRLDDGAGTVEFATVSGAPSWAGLVATITLASALVNTFSAGDKVSVCVDLGDLATAFGSWVETCAGDGAYDEAGNPLTLYDIGTISESWTLTFSSPTAFSVSGAAVGSVGSGNTSTDFQPANGGSYYFKLAAAGWSGTWASGDTVTFTTTHCGAAFWVKEVVPAGAAAYSGNSVTIAGKGESA